LSFLQESCNLKSFVENKDNLQNEHINLQKGFSLILLAGFDNSWTVTGRIRFSSDFDSMNSINLSCLETGENI